MDRQIKIRQIPTVPPLEDEALARFLSSVKSWIQMGSGGFSHATDQRFITEEEYNNLVTLINAADATLQAQLDDHETRITALEP